MAIVKGLSNNQAERNVVMQGFYEQLEIAQQSQFAQEASIKVKLYDIIEDAELSEEEKQSLKKPLINELEEIENKHIRIRRSILIGLYSFWEVSLNNILSSLPSVFHRPNNEPQQKYNKSKVWKYLNQIYGENIPDTSLLINGAIRECRNYMVHGKLSSSHMKVIKSLEVSNPEFCIKIIGGNCVVMNYTGLRQLLEFISSELDNAEYASITNQNSHN